MNGRAEQGKEGKERRKIFRLKKAVLKESNFSRQ